MREYYANSSSVITSGTVNEQYTGYEAGFDCTPKQNKDMVTLKLKISCGNEVITRYKYLVVK
ncbi:MAG: hypothetical protein EOP42_23040 [Sphingobacteriaceae bacterium]|nr:MAG: hypothetical protein EOP42_23040 [Sphingobacteriaceae bacterium]